MVTRKMNFLEKIDNIYLQEKAKFSIPADNNNFSCFIPLTAMGYESSCGFIIKKQEKAKLMITDGSQRVYLSDLHIINTVLSMEKTDIEWFLSQLIELYKGKGNKFKFNICGDIFEGCGISYYKESKKLTLFSDSIIDFNDFVFLINFVYTKDKCWETMKDLSDFSKRTLCKYIVLIDYYHNGSEKSERYLKNIGYPIDMKYPVNTKKDLIFSVEKFDISKYM